MARLSKNKISDYQLKIKERVGASDREIKNPISRTYKVIKTLNKMIKEHLISEDFSMVDITCGDAVVLSELKKSFPKMHAYGVECFKDKFDTHEGCYKQGIKIYNGYIQDMFIDNPKEKFDCAIMFNTYRGWESANLREHEKDLPELADNYFKNNIKYVFLTVTISQIEKLKKKGFNINILGDGEDASIMIVMWQKNSGEREISKSRFSIIKEKIYLRKKYIKQHPGRLKLNILGLKITITNRWI